MPDRYASKRRTRLGSAKGVSLIEVMLALSILSVVLLAMDGLMFQVARYTRQAAAISYRSAAMESAAAWVHGLPWDSIPSSVGCTDSLYTGSLQYTRCLELVTDTPRYRMTRVIVSPTGALQSSADTVSVERTKTRSPSPFSLN
ncbi:MAG: prepilin-type N-terminal cleavage/methylation domain-containing protein [Gemmatimonadales bacterium]